MKMKENSAKSFCCGTSISTYPVLPLPSNRLSRDGEEIRYSRQGTPICDQYRCTIYPTRMILGVADGCNWGEPPRDAARAAINAFTKYLISHHAEIGDVQYAGGLVLRALSMANAAIFEGKNEDSMIGTTTLFGGIVLELDVDYNHLLEFNTNPSPQNIPADFGFVYVSIGDCKCFHYCAHSKKFSDITASNRAGTLSASDCGGRLGPYEGNLPDLRNLELGFYPCNTGDYIIIVSDGVHDNLDPSHLGYLPRDFDIDADAWSKVPDFEKAEDVKNKYRISLLKKIIFGELDSPARKITKSFLSDSISDDDIMPDPITIVNNLLAHCVETCSAATNWMISNPKGRLPKDYRLYPGKMDHTTCLCVKVGELKQ